MDEKPDVAHRQLRDFADFLVAEIALKLQIDDFALVLGERIQHSKDLAGGLPLLQPRIDADVHVAEWCHPSLLLSRIEGEIAANGKQPRAEVLCDSRRTFFSAQTEE